MFNTGPASEHRYSLNQSLKLTIEKIKEKIKSDKIIMEKHQ